MTETLPGGVSERFAQMPESDTMSHSKDWLIRLQPHSNLPSEWTVYNSAVLRLGIEANNAIPIFEKSRLPLCDEVRNRILPYY